MNQEDPGPLPEAQVRTGRSFSIIWVVPVIALIIGGLLAYKAMRQKGPVITITFESAEGLEAGKTAIKYKDVVIGKVSEISILSDLSGVAVTAEMNRDAEEYMTDGTQFWVVRARVAAGEISGLGTLFSGAYIGCNPSTKGTETKEFKGLEKPPVLTEGMPGRHFVLQAKTLGSLDVGSPVYYRGIKVGQVVEYDFDKSAETVLIRVFVSAPYHEKVFENSRFWNAGGIDLSLDSTGVKMETQSLVSIMLGGVAFDLREYAEPGKPAEKNAAFRLYDDRQSSRKESYSVKSYYLMFFDESVRGLSPGAPVEIKGIKIGEVVKIELMYDMRKFDFRIPVLVMIEPERMNALITEDGKVIRGEQIDETIEGALAERHGVMRPQRLVEKGMRAQLKTGNLLTGQLYIDLDFHPDAPPAQMRIEHGYLVFPTIPESFERFMQRVENILKQVEQVPFDQLGRDVDGAVREMQGLLKELRLAARTVSEETVPRLNRELLPKINDTLDELKKTVGGIDQTLGSDSALNYNTRKISEELTMTIRSLRSLIEYLERDPQALILGKEAER